MSTDRVVKCPICGETMGDPAQGYDKLAQHMFALHTKNGKTTNAALVPVDQLQERPRQAVRLNRAQRRAARRRQRGKTYGRTS